MVDHLGITGEQLECLLLVINSTIMAMKVVQSYVYVCNCMLYRLITVESRLSCSYV